jgi:hypothetical protein
VPPPETPQSGRRRDAMTTLLERLKQEENWQET